MSADFAGVFLFPVYFSFFQRHILSGRILLV